MRLGFILACDAARLREDGRFDALGAGSQVVVIDPAQRLFSRTILVQLLCEAGDAGQERSVDIALVSARDEAVVGVRIKVTTQLHEPAGPEVLGAATPIDWRALHYAVHFDKRLEVDGDYRIVVRCDGEPLGEWPLRVLATDLAKLRTAFATD
jgi:hypothetical protein